MNTKPQRWRLPPSHLEQLKAAMGDGANGKTITPEMRLVVRKICSAPERIAFEPEDFLIAFKLALVDAANDVGIKPGPERNDFLSRLVTVYIEEFYRYPLKSDARDGAHKGGEQELSAGSP